MRLKFVVLHYLAYRRFQLQPERIISSYCMPVHAFLPSRSFACRYSNASARDSAFLHANTGRNWLELKQSSLVQAQM